MTIKFDREQMMAHVAEDKDFAEWYVEDFMKKHLPDRYYAPLMSEEGKREMVINGRNYARQLGFNDAEHQSHFITLMHQIGPNFWMFPGFKDIIEDTSLDEASKLAAFYEIPKELAVDAIINADSRYWYPEMIEFLAEHYPEELRLRKK